MDRKQYHGAFHPVENRNQHVCACRTGPNPGRSYVIAYSSIPTHAGGVGARVTPPEWLLNAP